MFILQFNNGLSTCLNACTTETVGPEAVEKCQNQGCGGAVRFYGYNEKSVQVGGVGLNQDGVYQYEAMSHD